MTNMESKYEWKYLWYLAVILGGFAAFVYATLKYQFNVMGCPCVTTYVFPAVEIL